MSGPIEKIHADLCTNLQYQGSILSTPLMEGSDIICLAIPANFSELDYTYDLGCKTGTPNAGTLTNKLHLSTRMQPALLIPGGS